ILSGVSVKTTKIGIGNAAVFAGVNPTAFTAGAPIVCADLVDAVGFCAEQIDVAVVLASLAVPTLIPGWTLPRFTAAKVSIATLAPLGLPSFFTMHFADLALSLNQGGVVKKGTAAVTGSNAWIDWAASFPGDTVSDPDVSVGLAIANGSGALSYIDMSRSVLGVTARTVLFNVSDFLVIRGSFAFERGGTATVDVATSGLTAAQQTDLGTAATNAGLTYAGGVISGVGITTTKIGIGNAVVFAGYNPDGFGTVATPPFVCADLTSAMGACADGIDVAIAIASLTTPGQISGFTLPRFTAAKVTIADLRPLGLPSELIIGFEGIALTINQGGVLKQGTTSLSSSKAWIDWGTSFPGDPTADPHIPAGLPVDTGSGTAYIDMHDPVLGISAEKITLRISSFISISGSFSIQKGGLVDLAIEAPALSPADLTTLQGKISNSVRTGNAVVVNGVETTAFGIGNASIYVGYADGGFGTDGAPVAAGSFYGVQATGIELGLILAKVAPTRLTGITLPNFVGLTAFIASVGFSGIPTDIFELGLTGVTIGYNNSGPITGMIGSPASYVNWKNSGAGGTGVSIPTNGSGGAVVIRHQNTMFGIAATQAILGIGDFVRISGSFSFQNGAIEKVVVEALGVNALELQALKAAADLDGTEPGGLTVTGTTSVKIQNLLVKTTLIGIDNAAVFVGYNPDEFPAGAVVSCADLKADGDPFGFCLDGITFGLALAKTLPNQLGALGAPKFMGMRASLASFSINDFLGMPDISTYFTLYFEGLQLTVNKSAKLGAAGTAWIDWKESFPSQGGEPVGLLVPTGGTPVRINFDSPVIGVSADFVVMSISDFVHVSGGFAFETGGLRGVDVDVRTAGLGLQKYDDIQVKTTTFGISNAS
ncbi:MAG: hypothetical protein JWP82_317, partial [Humibacillus sp.]|nr:hypothetical protein [Humibacillus sp.]